MSAAYSPARCDELDGIAAIGLGQSQEDLDAVREAVWARALPLVGGTREDMERRVHAVIGTRPAAPDDLRQVAQLFGLTVTSQPDAA